MKAAWLLLLAAFAAGAAGAPPAGDDGFVPIATDYKKPQELTEKSFNPFKIQGASESDSQNREDPAVTNHAVLQAVELRGVTGVLYAPDGKANRVIIGDQVFGVGDDLSFPAIDRGGPVPLMTGASVILRAVGRDGLTLDVTPDGESTRELSYSLSGFWRP